MIRSMWSAVSGLRAHQAYLDVTGNNIANVNTDGYKASRAIFEDSLAQQLRAAAAPNEPGAVGGLNPTQVGLGTRLSQVSGNFAQGGLQVTNQATDFAIQGDGFFIVDRAGEKYYTRNGAFHLDAVGDLVDNQGYYVQGLYGDGSLPDKIDPSGAGESRTKITIDAAKWRSWQVAPNGRISGVATDDPTSTLVDIGQIVLATFPNPNGLERVGSTTFRQTLNSGSPRFGYPGAIETGMGFLTQGALEMSNVDLAAEFTNLIMAQRGFQANSKVVTASDEVLQDLIQMKR